MSGTATRLQITIPVTEEWNYMFQPSVFYLYSQRPFQRGSGREDFVTYSEHYSALCREPVWFYSCGNTRWLRCPIGCPGDRQNTNGDRIATVDVALKYGKWVFVVSVVEGSRYALGSRSRSTQ